MLLLLIALVLVSTAGEIIQSTPAHVGDLAWLAGDWQTTAGPRRVDEHWTAPSGGAMLGMSRTVKGDSMVAFEYLRIVERADGVFYVAHPNARTPGTDFRLSSLTTTRVVFENPQHDFPKRIIYEKKGEHGLSAMVDAGEGTDAETYEMYGYIELAGERPTGVRSGYRRSGSVRTREVGLAARDAMATMPA